MTMFFERFRKIDDERASLPAVMGAAILISATALLLGAFAVASTRNAEVSTSKTSMNAAITNCERTLNTTVQTTFPQDTIGTSPKSNLLSTADQDSTVTTNLNLKTLAERSCNYPGIKTQVRIAFDNASIAPTNYLANGSTIPNSVRVTFRATYQGFSTSTVDQVRYLKYPDLAAAQKVTSNSYISSYDSDGNAVWVNLTE
jgi:hypothetical protein